MCAEYLWQYYKANLGIDSWWPNEIHVYIDAAVDAARFDVWMK